jgi:hypothetical protein
VGQGHPHARRRAAKGIGALTEGVERLRQHLEPLLHALGEDVACAQRQIGKRHEPDVARVAGNLNALGSAGGGRVEVAAVAVGARQPPHGFGARAAHGQAVAQVNRRAVPADRVAIARVVHADDRGLCGMKHPGYVAGGPCAHLKRVAQTHVGHRGDKGRLHALAQGNALLRQREGTPRLPHECADQREEQDGLAVGARRPDGSLRVGRRGQLFGMGQRFERLARLGQPPRAQPDAGVQRLDVGSLRA